MPYNEHAAQTKTIIEALEKAGDKHLQTYTAPTSQVQYWWLGDKYIILQCMKGGYQLFTDPGYSLLEDLEYVKQLGQKS